MNALPALTLYPVWALAMLMATTALRLGRSARTLVTLCLQLAGWVTVLVLLRHPHTSAAAERLVPAGMLLAGGFAHAGAELLGRRSRALVMAAYLFGALVALLGLLAPRLFYGPGLRDIGPLFWPLFVVSGASSLALLAWMFQGARQGRGGQRRRRLVLVLGQLAAVLGGGGAVSLHLLARVPLEAAAPPLLCAVLLISYGILLAERGRSRRILGQGLLYAVVAAGLSAVGLVLFLRLLPQLVPGAGRQLGWLLLVVFLAALPLDPLRVLLVEQLGRRLFADPIGTRDLAEEIDRSRVRADQAGRLAEIGTMASAVAHEMRNPLGIIAAQAALLQRRGADPESVQALRAEVERARRFLDDLLRFSKPRPLELALVPVGETLRRAAASACQGDVAAAARIEWQLGAAEPLELEADPSGFHDVHTALIHNAVAANADRPGARIVVAAERHPDALLVSVQDDGPGVPSEIAARLFQPFVTGRGRDAVHPGTGLGLAIAASWVERHGGNISHQRPPGGGARFVVRWPGQVGAHG
jgi:signal transduction histidine kinase